MSRTYEVEVEIQGIDESQEFLAKQIIAYVTICYLDSCKIDTGYIFHGLLSLYGGMSEREAHDILIKIIRETFPNSASIGTRWLHVDEKMWDESFWDYPENK